MRRQFIGPEKRLLAAAENGDANAQFNLGVLCDSRFDSNDRSIEGNRAEALKWLLRAAKQGLSRAQSRLAELYAEGPDAPKNCVKTAFWFQLAMANLTGAYRQTAQSGYDRVTALMTPSQIAKAQRAASVWQPTRQETSAPIASPRSR